MRWRTPRQPALTPWRTASRSPATRGRPPLRRRPQAAPGPQAAPDRGRAGPLAGTARWPDPQALPDDRAKKPPVWWRAARSLGGSRHHDVDEDWLRSLRGPQSQPPPGGYPRRGTPAE